MHCFLAKDCPTDCDYAEEGNLWQDPVLQSMELTIEQVTQMVFEQAVAKLRAGDSAAVVESELLKMGMQPAAAKMMLEKALQATGRQE